MHCSIDVFEHMETYPPQEGRDSWRGKVAQMLRWWREEEEDGDRQSGKSTYRIDIFPEKKWDFYNFSDTFSFDVVLLFSYIAVAELTLLRPLVIPPRPKQKVNPKISYTDCKSLCRANENL